LFPLVPTLCVGTPAQTFYVEYYVKYYVKYGE
jgi:hypothetical protein